MQEVGRDSKSSSSVVLHVGQGKSTIDLPKPSETLDVSVRGDSQV